MLNSRGHDSLGGNGAWREFKMQRQPEFQITLKTGYEVKFSNKSFFKDLEHFTRALLGEHLMKTAGQAKNWDAGFRDLREGMQHVVEQLSPSELRALAHGMIWHLCVLEWGRLHKAVGRRTGKKRGKSSSTRERRSKSK